MLDKQLEDNSFDFLNSLTRETLPEPSDTPNVIMGDQHVITTLNDEGEETLATVVLSVVDGVKEK
jgi:hypothetical protein